MLKTELLCFAYNDQTKFSFPNINLSVGDRLLILGESGVGKTTLLHLLAGLLPVKSGNIIINGTTINRLRVGKLDRFRSKNVGIIFQKPHFVQAISLKENLLLAQHLSQRSTDPVRVHFVAERLGIDHLLHKKPKHLSTGEQQRGAIVLALVNKPKVILADEPTSSLDDKNCLKVISLLQEEAASTQAILIVITHDQRLKGQFKNIVTL